MFVSTITKKINVISMISAPSTASDLQGVPGDHLEQQQARQRDPGGRQRHPHKAAPKPLQRLRGGAPHLVRPDRVGTADRAWLDLVVRRLLVHVRGLRAGARVTLLPGQVLRVHQVLPPELPRASLGQAQQSPVEVSSLSGSGGCRPRRRRRRDARQEEDTRGQGQQKVSSLAYPLCWVFKS